MQKKSYLLAAAGLILGVLVLVWNNSPEKTMIDKDLLKPDLSGYKNQIFITPAQLNRQLGSKDIVILDGSHPKGYAKGHIPGAVSIGFKGLSDCRGRPGDKGWGTVLPKKELTRKLESLGIDNTKLVVAYSDIFKGPGAGGRAVWQMKMAGLENVRLLYGGLELWKRSGYELSKTPVRPVPVSGLTLEAYDESFSATQDYIHRNLTRIKLVDVRSLDEYTGSDTSRGEARGGHIRGAQWLEWTALLTDTGVKSPRKIKQMMAGIGIRPEDDFVLY